MKRLAVFVFYDKEGIVDDYVLYLLQELQKCVTDLLIVVNGKLTPEGQEKLSRFTEHFYLRENKGYDAMAYKLAMTDYMGWERIVQYDEVLLTNDTYYGPFYPFCEAFDEMEGRQVDFWGLTCQQESTDYFSYHKKIVPAYIQSFFCVFRKQVLSNTQFQEYWEKFDSTGWIFSDVINLHEKVFTKKLEGMGFVWDTYIREKDFESANPSQNFVQYYYIAHRLIKEHRCPVLKRKNFIRKHLTENYGGTGEDVSLAFRFIKEETSYDTDMIWANLLRLYDIGDIQKTLNLNYIISGEENETAQGEAVDAAAVVYLANECCFDECMQYLARMSAVMDVYLLTDSRELLNRAQALSSRMHPVLTQSVSQEKQHLLFLGKAAELIENYSYFVFLGDVDYVGEKGSRLQEYSMFRNIWSNLAKNQSYIQEVCRIFDQNPRLGILSVPQPVTGTAFGGLGNQRAGDVGDVRKVLTELGISKDISSYSDSLNNCHFFWCRSDFLKVYISYLINFGIKYQSKTVEKTYPYLAQAAGYYTAVVMNDSWAAAAYTVMQELLKRIVRQTQAKYEFTDFDSYLDGDVLEYCRRFGRNMVYGAGENGYRAACLLKNAGMTFAGYLVSDGQPHPEEKYGDRLITVSQLPKGEEDLGIVVSVANPKFQSEIVENLHRLGYRDIYIL